MTFRKIICLGLFVIFSASTLASASGSEFYLRKLSRRVRGIDPSQKEYQDLAQAKDQKAFLNQKIQEYVSSTDHVDTLTVKMDELFQVGVPPLPYFRHSPYSDSVRLRPEFANSMDAL